MKFLSGLLGKKTGEDQSKQQRWAMSPLEARHRAKMIIKSAANFGVELDYSPESLTKVDFLIDRERDTGLGLTKEMAVVMLCIGAYAGEVIVRHINAKWVYGNDDAQHDPLLILYADKYAINVVSMVFRRFIQGEPHSVAGMYEETKKLQ
jgi:hypothetical protein